MKTWALACLTSRQTDGQFLEHFIQQSGIIYMVTTSLEKLKTAGSLVVLRKSQESDQTSGKCQINFLGELSSK